MRNLLVIHSGYAAQSAVCMSKHLIQTFRHDDTYPFNLTYGRVGEVDNPDPMDIVLNWGTRWHNRRAKMIINPQYAREKVTDKRYMRTLFAEHGVAAPELYLNIDDITEANLPVVGRPDYHEEGKELYACYTMDEVIAARRAGATHFMRLVPNTDEYRLHMVFDDIDDEGNATDWKCVRVVKKWHKEKAKALREGTGSKYAIAKNAARGWCFYSLKDDFVNSDKYHQCVALAKQAMEVFGLHFSAVDIMWDKERNVPLILEHNTAPGIMYGWAKTGSAYMNQFLKMFLLMNQKLDERGL